MYRETIGKHYSFIHFFLVFVYPFTAWVCTIEVDTLMPQSNDHNWDVSFGQVSHLVNSSLAKIMIPFHPDPPASHHDSTYHFRVQTCPTVRDVVLGSSLGASYHRSCTAILEEADPPGVRGAG